MFTVRFEQSCPPYSEVYTTGSQTSDLVIFGRGHWGPIDDFPGSGSIRPLGVTWPYTMIGDRAREGGEI